MEKHFKLSPGQFRQLVGKLGSCFATDMITVQGKRVGYMYRERPNNPIDSGWRFFSGDESQEFVDDANNTMIYDVNTIANYDQDIIPFLDAPYDSAFGRDPRSGKFVEEKFEPIE